MTQTNPILGTLDATTNHDRKLIEAARSLGPMLRENADRGERERRLPPASAKALTKAGLFRLCRPRDLGGFETDPLTVLAICEELARHDGSAAWCALNCSAAGMVQAFLSRDGARELGVAPDLVVNGVFAPNGRAVQVEGGYRVSGRWAFVSNCEYCQWVNLGCIVFKGETTSMGPDGPEIVGAWMKTSDCRILDTWHTVGMRATGSHDIEVTDLFVPASRVTSLPMIDPVAKGVLFRFPMVGMFAIGMAAQALGMAQAAIDEVLRLAAAKTPFGMTSTLATRTTAQIAVCEALGLVQSARALLFEETSRIWDMVHTIKDVPADRRARLRLAATHATTVAAGVIDRMYTTAGGSAVYSSGPLQRYVRDVRGITQHFFVAPATYEVIGKVLLGVEPDGFML
jgi:alkylation response protein AidB-like acyl-CoA dehydrogenase